MCLKKDYIDNITSHSIFFDLIYRKRDRDIQMFINPNYNGGKLKIHSSVFDRLAQMKYHNNRLSRKHFWFDHEKFADCFEKKNDSLRIFNQDKCKFIQKVTDDDKVSPAEKELP